MSRLDYVTLGIIVVCVAALGFIIYRSIQFRNQENDLTKQESAADDSYQDYDYDYLQDTSQILPPTEDFPADAGDLNATDSEPAPSESSAGSSRTETYDNPPGTTTSSTGEYLVLAGSFSIKSNAESHASKIRSLGYRSAAVEPFNRGAYAVVMVDRFRSESEARNLVAELKNKGIEAYVHQKREAE